MLGTNDTKGYNYSQIKADSGEQYKKDIIALIEGYFPTIQACQGYVAHAVREKQIKGRGDVFCNMTKTEDIINGMQVKLL